MPITNSGVGGGGDEAGFLGLKSSKLKRMHEFANYTQKKDVKKTPYLPDETENSVCSFNALQTDLRGEVGSSV